MTKLEKLRKFTLFFLEKNIEIDYQKENLKTAKLSNKFTSCVGLIAFGIFTIYRWVQILKYKDQDATERNYLNYLSFIGIGLNWVVINIRKVQNFRGCLFIIIQWIFEIERQLHFDEEQNIVSIRYIYL